MLSTVAASIFQGPLRSLMPHLESIGVIYITKKDWSLRVPASYCGGVSAQKTTKHVVLLAVRIILDECMSYACHIITHNKPFLHATIAIHTQSFLHAIIDIQNKPLLHAIIAIHNKPFLHATIAIHKEPFLHATIAIHKEPFLHATIISHT